jgi:hypothetical protein
MSDPPNSQHHREDSNLPSYSSSLCLAPNSIVLPFLVTARNMALCVMYITVGTFEIYLTKFLLFSSSSTENAPKTIEDVDRSRT